MSSSSTAIWVRSPFWRTAITRSTASRRARNSASVRIGARRRLVSRPSRRRCRLASSRVEPLTPLTPSSPDLRPAARGHGRRCSAESRRRRPRSPRSRVGGGGDVRVAVDSAGIGDRRRRSPRPARPRPRAVRRRCPPAVAVASLSFRPHGLPRGHDGRGGGVDAPRWPRRRGFPASSGRPSVLGVLGAVSRSGRARAPAAAARPAGAGDAAGRWPRPRSRPRLTEVLGLGRLGLGVLGRGESAPAVGAGWIAACSVSAGRRCAAGRLRRRPGRALARPPAPGSGYGRAWPCACRGAARVHPVPRLGAARRPRSAVTAAALRALLRAGGDGFSARARSAAPRQASGRPSWPRACAGPGQRRRLAGSAAAPGRPRPCRQRPWGRPGPVFAARLRGAVGWWSLRDSGGCDRRWVLSGSSMCSGHSVSRPPGAVRRSTRPRPHRGGCGETAPIRAVPAKSASGQLVRHGARWVVVLRRSRPAPVGGQRVTDRT